jgi:hypothetical protein
MNECGRRRRFAPIFSWKKILIKKAFNCWFTVVSCWSFFGPEPIPKRHNREKGKGKQTKLIRRKKSGEGEEEVKTTTTIDCEIGIPIFWIVFVYFY